MKLSRKKTLITKKTNSYEAKLGQTSYNKNKSLSSRYKGFTNTGTVDMLWKDKRREKRLLEHMELMGNRWRQ